MTATDQPVDGGAPGGRRNYDAVLFDFGGVFTSSPFAAVAAAAEGMGVTPTVLAEVLFGPYSRDTDHPWHRLERGEIAFEAAITEINADAAAAGVVGDPWQVLMSMAGGGAREYMVDAVRELRRRGLKTAVVTNNLREFAEHWKKMVPMDLFDFVADSSELGMRKPAPGIYQRTLEELGVRAERSIFVDDAPGNVSAAAELGITSLLVGHSETEAAAVAEELLRLTAVEL